MSAWEHAGKRFLGSLPGMRRAGCRGAPRFTPTQGSALSPHTSKHIAAKHTSVFLRVMRSFLMAARRRLRCSTWGVTRRWILGHLMVVLPFCVAGRGESDR